MHNTILTVPSPPLQARTGPPYAEITWISAKGPLHGHKAECCMIEVCIGMVARHIAECCVINIYIGVMRDCTEPQYLPHMVCCLDYPNY